LFTESIQYGDTSSTAPLTAGSLDQWNPIIAKE